MSRFFEKLHVCFLGKSYENGDFEDWESIDTEA